MIPGNRGIKLAAAMIAAVSLFGVVTPVFAAEVIPRAEAQSAAVRSTVDQLSDRASQLSGRAKLQGVIDVLTIQVSDLEKSLASLKGLNEQQVAARDEYISFLEDMSKFLTAVEIDAETADVKFLADQIRIWREETLGPRIPGIVNFVLVFQVRSVLNTAESRYLRIFADVGRLEDLKILKGSKARNLMGESLSLLTSAGELRNQAEAFLFKEGVPDSQLRQLLNDSIVRIKLAYKKFLDISLEVKGALK